MNSSDNEKAKVKNIPITSIHVQIHCNCSNVLLLGSQKCYGIALMTEALQSSDRDSLRRIRKEDEEGKLPFM